MNSLEGRVAIITGAGRGIGREHALLFAREGAKVVVNDLSGPPRDGGADVSPAAEVAAEIVAAGGEAVDNSDDVTSWDGARRLVDTAVEAFGDLHVLVNNAGALRDRMLVNMSEEDWDFVVDVNLKGHFCPSRWAASYWRQRVKDGAEVHAAIINTSSASGLFGNVGQTNYAAAKMGIAALTMVAADELGRYGVRVNAIAPSARTRLTEGIVPDVDDAKEFDPMDPANVSPWVAYLASERCPITGRVFRVAGGRVELCQPWAVVEAMERPRRWTVEELAEEGPHLGEFPFNLGFRPAARSSS